MIGDDPRRPAATRAAVNAPTFCDRFVAQIKPDSRRDGIAVLRRVAARVLDGVHWQFIPTVSHRCSRRQLVEVPTLAMLCACLDDHEVGATPGCVTPEQLSLAWLAAGHHAWLEYRLRQRVIEQASLRAALEVGLPLNPAKFGEGSR